MKIEHVEGNLYRLGKTLVEKTADSGAAQNLFLRGLAAEDAGDKANALICYEGALAHDPELAGAWINLGTIHYGRKKYVLAARCYERALAASPNYALAHFNLANALEENAQYSEAAAHYRRAIQISPRYADAHCNLARLLRIHMHEYSPAIAHYELFLRYADPGDPDRKKVERTIDRLRARGPRLVSNPSCTEAV